MEGLQLAIHGLAEVHPIDRKSMPKSHPIIEDTSHWFYHPDISLVRRDTLHVDGERPLLSKWFPHQLK